MAANSGLLGGADADIVRFGEFELDRAQRELRQSGGSVEIEPKAFDLLDFLVRHRHEAISKDQLLEHLWPGSIVTETALTRCVMKARRAVGDSADSQHTIKTVHGHGYRFIAQLENPAPAEPATIQAAGADLPSRSRRGWMAAVAAVVLVGIATLATYWLAGNNQPFAASRLAVLPLIDQTDDPELAWVATGMMGLMTRMATEAGLDTTPDGTVLALADELPKALTLKTADVDLLSRRLGAGLLLSTQLRRRAGLFELTFQLVDTTGTRIQRVIVGDSPTGLAADALAIVREQVKPHDRVETSRLRKVSDDPFVNEAYARALSLEFGGDFAAARDLFRAAAQQAPDIFWLRYEIFICTRELREWAEAELYLDKLLIEARDHGDRDAEVAVLNSAGVMALQRQRYADAEIAFEQALAKIPEGDLPSRRATLYLNLALVARNQDDLQGARELMEKSLLEFDQADLDAPPTLLNNFAGLLMSEGDLDTAREYAQEAIAGFRLRGQRLYEGYAVNRLGKIMRRLGDTDAALARHQQAMAIHNDIDNQLGSAVAQAALSSVYRVTGDLTRAKANALESRDRAIALDHPGLLADSHMQLAQVASLREAHRDAINDYRQAERLFDSIGEVTGLRSAREGLARRLIAVEQFAEADKIIEQLESASAPNSVARIQAELLRGQWHGQQGQLVDAQQRLAPLQAHPDKRLRKLATIIGAEALLADDDAAGAAQWLENLDQIDEQDWHELRLRAKVAVATGDKETAVTYLLDLRSRAGEAFLARDAALLAELQE